MSLFNSGESAFGILTTHRSKVIDHLYIEKKRSGNDVNVVIAFFFIRFNDIASQEAEGILRSITRQLLELTPLNENIEALLEEMEAGHHSIFDIIEDILEEVACRVRRLFVVIDGLDELQERERASLFSILKTVMRHTCIRLYLSGRDSVSREIYGRFGDVEHVSFSCEVAKDDIATYINETLERRLEEQLLVVGDPLLIGEIKILLIRQAEGM